jgi:hypothetical protein
MKKKQLAQKKKAWQQSLEDRLKLGWTDRGQTEEIVRSACVKAHIFGDGYRDDQAIVQEIISLPGYIEYCDHQHEIVQYVTEWMEVTSKSWSRRRRKVQPSQQEQPLQKPPKAKARSTKLQDEVLSRLRQTVAALADRPLPTKIGDIVQMIQAKAKEMFGKVFSVGTLYNYRYRKEWRILIEIAQSQPHNQQSVDQNVS